MLAVRRVAAMNREQGCGAEVLTSQCGNHDENGIWMSKIEE